MIDDTIEKLAHSEEKEFLEIGFQTLSGPAVNRNTINTSGMAAIMPSRVSTIRLYNAHLVV